LVRSLSQTLSRDFSFSANPEAILERDPAEQDTRGAKDNMTLQNMILFGGSNLSKLAPILRERGGTIIDCTRSGWIISKANIKEAVGELEKVVPGLEGNTGVVLDLFGNSITKFQHVDGALVLPIKLGGSYHLLGDVTVESDEGCRNLLRIAEPLFRAVENLPTLVVPPSPRYIFGKCCSDASHAPNMGDPDHAARAVKKYEHVRGVMKSELVGKDWMQHFWVMDGLAILGKVPASMEEKLKGLRNCLASDGVHYTDWGYQNWYCSMSNSMARVLRRMAKAKGSKDSEEIISGGVYTWRGFSSPRGSTRRPTPTPGPPGVLVEVLGVVQCMEAAAVEGQQAGADQHALGNHMTILDSVDSRSFE